MIPPAVGYLIVKAMITSKSIGCRKISEEVLDFQSSNYVFTKFATDSTRDFRTRAVGRWQTYILGEISMDR